MHQFFQSAWVNKPVLSLLRFFSNCAFAVFVFLNFAGCTLGQHNGDAFEADQGLQEQTKKILMQSFEAKGQAGLDRLIQDPTQEFCSAQRGFLDPESKVNRTDAGRRNYSEQPQFQSPEQTAETLRLANLVQITPAVDGNYFGDFKRGELIAQDGRGKTWTDPSESKNGGNCYNCHRLSKNELSYGTLGPSLYQYGKSRGIKTVEDFMMKTKVAASDPVVQYTWGVLMNAKAYDLCTAMPRFGVSVGSRAGAQDSARHAPILSQDEIKDLMSLLLDPRSPVNN